MQLINCEVNLILTWSWTCVIINSSGEGRFTITDTKLYVPVVTLSAQDNVKLLQQLKSGYKRTINCNKCQSDSKSYAKNRYLNHLVNPSFQGVKDLYYLTKLEVKECNVMIGGKNVFDQPINSKLKTYENIRKIATGKGDEYTTGCLLCYSWFKENYKMIAIDSSNQQALDADARAIQQINFTPNLDREGNTKMFFIIEESKETVLDFSQGTVKVL